MRILVKLLGFYPHRHGVAIGEWRYVEKFGAYLYRGEPMKPAEFNEFAGSKQWVRLIEEHGAKVRVECINHNSMQAARKALAESAPPDLAEVSRA